MTTTSTASAAATLASRFGFAAFRPGQEQVVEALLAGRSALAVFPTGAGKSLCYQLPALLLDGVTVVVSPLIALMKDQIDALTRQGIHAARLDSSLGPDEVRDVGERLAAGRLRLLYVAPERFNNERFLAQLERTRISLFAVDEAHCISEWGHNFRPDYLKLAAWARTLGAERVLALTATATPAVVVDIRSGFGIAEADTVVTGFYRPNLTLLTTPAGASERERLLIDRLRERPPGTTIVYVTLQRTALRIASLLAASGLPARAYHAGMSPEDRVAVQEWWTASDRNIVVATVAFGMGIDKADVRYVYHFNLPKGLESYSQEIGRAGRDGANSICELYACREDIPALENFAFGDTPTPEAVGQLLDFVFDREEGTQFAASEYELSGRFDVRPLVLKTILTYLELDGLLHQGTPFYAGYSFRPLPGPGGAQRSWGEVFAAFDPERADFLARLVAAGKTGRTWTSLDPDEAALTLGEDRERIVRALGHLEQQQLVELRASDARQRYTVLRQPGPTAPNVGEPVGAVLAADSPGCAAHGPDVSGSNLPDSEAGESSLPAPRSALVGRLVARFEQREQAEVERIERVVALVLHAGCQVNELVGYFGEVRAGPCGHCSFCLTQTAQRLPAAVAAPELDAVVEVLELDELAAEHPAALGAPRQRARFLCGIASPATSRAKLTRSPLFGVAADRRFLDVLAWCSR